MGGNSSSGGGGGRRASQSVNQYSQAAKQKEEKARQRELAAVKGGGSVVEKEREEFKEQGAKNIRELVSKFPSPILSMASVPLQKGSRYTRDYFKSEVLGKGAYKGTDVTSFEAMSRPAQESMYKSYITGRTSGKTDAYGRKITSTDKKSGGAIGTSGQVVQAPKPVTSPTTAEVSQSAAAQAQEDITLRKRRILSKGRSPTIITGATGATGSFTLGKPSLLGK